MNVQEAVLLKEKTEKEIVEFLNNAIKNLSESIGLDISNINLEMNKRQVVGKYVYNPTCEITIVLD